MKKRIIKFHSVSTGLDIMRPAPAASFMPKWFKKMPNVNDGIMSVKKCIPFLDAYTSGYMIPLAADMTWDDVSKKFDSQSIAELNSDHYITQVSGMDLGEAFDEQPHKWINMWQITVPKGYSVLFTHPVNRDDLPFRSFSGIVDADRHPVVINFPFVLKKGFSGTIPAGTPIIQLFPFKREKWKANVVDTGESYRYDRAYEVLQPPFGWYKRKFWTRKFFS